MGLSRGVKTSSSAQQTVFDDARIPDAPVAPRFSSISSRRDCRGMTPAQVAASHALPLSPSRSRPPALALPLSPSLSRPPSLALPLSPSLSRPPSLALPHSSRALSHVLAGFPRLWLFAMSASACSWPTLEHSSARGCGHRDTRGCGHTMPATMTESVTRGECGAGEQVQPGRNRPP